MTNQDSISQNKVKNNRVIGAFRFYLQGLHFIKYNILILFLAFIFNIPRIYIGFRTDPRFISAVLRLIIFAISIFVASLSRSMYIYYGVLAERKEKVPGNMNTIKLALNKFILPILGSTIVLALINIMTASIFPLWIYIYTITKFIFIIPTIVLAPISIVMVLIFSLGIYIYNRLSFAQYLIVEERLSIRQSFKKSWKISRGRWWEIMSVRMVFLTFIAPVLLILIGVWGIALAIGFDNHKIPFDLGIQNIYTTLQQSLGNEVMSILLFITIMASLAIFSGALFNYPLATINMARTKSLIINTKNKISIWPAIAGMIMATILIAQVLVGILSLYYYNQPNIDYNLELKSEEKSTYNYIMPNNHSDFNQNKVNLEG